MMRWSMDVHEYAAHVVLLSARRLTMFQIKKLEGSTRQSFLVHPQLVCYSLDFDRVPES